jgi:hypothetical protein
MGLLGTACGPESYFPGGPTRDGAAESSSGGHAGGDAQEARSCVGAGGAGAGDDAGLPSFLSSWTFDGPGVDGWVVGGQPADVVAGSTATFNGQDGFPALGSARVTVPFTGDSQQIAFELNFSQGMNFSGKTLSARVRMESCAYGGTVLAGLAYKSISPYYLFASSMVAPITSRGGWITVNLNFDAPDGFIDMSRTDADGGLVVPDPTDVLEIDVIILTGGGPFGTVDVGVDTVGITNAQRGADGGAADHPG